MLFAQKSPLLLYPFRYFDPVRKRWVRARYVAELREIAELYAAEWEITVAERCFRPHRRTAFEVQQCGRPPDQ
jgi:hypothetical protein